MAIACAGLLGYKLPKNFEAPYLSTNLILFWRRWHISLSTWLRDYVYIPLGGSHFGSANTYRNLMLTMLLGGLWHGASWTFVVWGGLHGIALCINHFWHSILKQKIYIFSNIISTITGFLTLWFIHLCWIFFRASDFESALLITKLYTFTQNGGNVSLPVFVLILPILLGCIHIMGHNFQFNRRISTLPDFTFTVILAFLSILALSFVPTGYQPFIYFQF